MRAEGTHAQLSLRRTLNSIQDILCTYGIFHSTVSPSPFCAGTQIVAAWLLWCQGWRGRGRSRECLIQGFEKPFPLDLESSDSPAVFKDHRYDRWWRIVNAPRGLMQSRYLFGMELHDRVVAFQKLAFPAWCGEDMIHILHRWTPKVEFVPVSDPFCPCVFISK